MKFSWDTRKADSNLRKHDIAFDEAITVFSDPRPSSKRTVCCGSLSLEYIEWHHAQVGEGWVALQTVH